MPNQAIQPDAAMLPKREVVRDAPALEIRQAGSFGIKFVGIPGRITNGGISTRVIRVGVAAP